MGGIVANRKMFGSLLSGVDHMPHTHDLSRNAFSRGEPEHGAELADELERIALLHDPSTIAAVIVEPVAGSTGGAGEPRTPVSHCRHLHSGQLRPPPRPRPPRQRARAAPRGPASNTGRPRPTRHACPGKISNAAEGAAPRAVGGRTRGIQREGNFFLETRGAGRDAIKTKRRPCAADR